MRILHITTGLNDGGAEAMLYRLITNSKHNEHVVISLMDAGKYGPPLRGHGIQVFTLDLKRRQLTLGAVFRLFRLVWRYRSYRVQTWMYHGDFLGGLAAYFCGCKQIFWGVHNTVLEPGISTRSTIWLAKFLAKISSFVPSGIVVVSLRAISIHKSLGYMNKKMQFIPNGYDLELFCPDKSAGLDLRGKHGLSPALKIIGCVGRFDPYKDHSNLLEALSILRSRNVEFLCVLVGNGMDRDNKALYTLISNYGLEAQVLLLGQRNDIPKIMNLIDIHVLSSSAEAFPNVVCEAMACGTPCVVTDVGDARSIVSDTGWVVPPQNAMFLADAIELALNEVKSRYWHDRCEMARLRIVNNFSIQKVVEMYDDYWASF